MRRAPECDADRTKTRPIHRAIGCLRPTILVAISCAAFGCSDVGDSSAVPGSGNGSGDDGAAQSDDSAALPDADAAVTPGIEAVAPGNAVTGDAQMGAADSPVDQTVRQQPDVQSQPQEAGGVVDATTMNHDAGSGVGVPEASITQDATTDSSGPDTGEDSASDVAVDASDGNAGQDAGSDAESDAGIDGGPPDAADAGAPESGSSLAPCTTSGQANCVKCTGNTAHGLACTPTEEIIVNYDIKNGRLTGSQLSMDSCYACLVKFGCIDDDVTGDSNMECGDLTGTVGAGAQAAETKTQACLDTLTCVLSSGCPNAAVQNPGATDGISNCFCGSNAPTAIACSAAPTIAAGPANMAPNGSCAQTEIDGLGNTTSTTNTNVLMSFNTNSSGSGMANAILQCAGSNTQTFACPGCFQ
jgi:hypothetical protein